MKIVVAVALVAVLTGCAPMPRQPVDVSLIPNDCANRHAIIRWLESTLPGVYDAPAISATRARIWSLRYHCQPV